MKRSPLKRTTPLADYSRAKGSRSGKTISCAREGCEVQFYVQPASLDRRKTCSRECAAVVKAANEGFKARTGKQNPNFRHGGTLGQQDRELGRHFNLRLKGETCCRNCGSAENVQLHHVIPRSIGTSATRLALLNGLPLCASCHMTWHRGKNNIPRSVFTAEEWEYLTSVQLTGRQTAAWLDKRYPLHVERTYRKEAA